MATTASACIPDTAHGTHVFTVAGYRLHKGLGVGNFIRSATFAVGGYDWCIHYYPDGDGPSNEDYVSVCVELQSKNSVVRALYDLRLTNRATGLSSLIFPAFDSCNCKNEHVRGAYMFMRRDLLEASPYLQDDCIMIHCDVTVLLMKIPPVATATTKTPEIEVPPSDLLNNLAMLLEEKKGADVVIRVSWETFHAHKIVLAMRSPVFDTELYGPMAMWDTEMQCIEIVDMQPAVFGALLHFIYTDSLPAMDDLLDSHDKREVIRHLLVAADRCSSHSKFSALPQNFRWVCSFRWQLKPERRRYYGSMGRQTGWYCLKPGTLDVHFSKSRAHCLKPANSRWYTNR